MTHGLRKTALLATVFVFLGAGLSMAFWPKRPSVLGLDISSEPSQPKVMRLIQDGRAVVKQSMRGRVEVGGIDYASVFSSNISYALYWYDLDNAQGYEIAFKVDAKTLSTFGDAGDHASMRILAGPGADVTITTKQPELLRLIGLGREAEATPDMDAPVILSELCATPVGRDHQVIAELSSNIDEISLKAANRRRDVWRESGNPIEPRCGGKQ